MTLEKHEDLPIATALKWAGHAGRLAAQLGVSRRTVQIWAKSGKWPVRRQQAVRGLYEGKW